MQAYPGVNHALSPAGPRRLLHPHWNGKTPPSKALVKGLANELDINESYLEKLAAEVRKDLG